MLLTDSVNKLPYIGDKYLKLLLKLDITSISELLYYFPRQYADSSEIVPISELSRTEIKTTIATIEEVTNIRTKNRKSLQKGIISDGVDSIEVIWFNQPFLTKTVKAGTKLFLSGKLSEKSIKPQFVSPNYEIIKDGVEKSIHIGRIVPKYPLTRGISAKWLRTRIYHLVKHIQLIQDLDETLPDWLLEKYKLIDKTKAISNIHFPDSTEEIIKARRRLGFEELIDIQTKLINENQKRLDSKAVKVNIVEEDVKQLIDELPFKLTSTQQIAYQEIYNDFLEPYPMKRLLQGDVGSGKTVIAALAALPLLSNNKQVVLLAPTAVLAEQHFESFEKYFGNKYSIGLITSQSKKADKETHYDFIIGTHAVLHHKDKLISELGLLIVDEEHRFGVKQRRELGYFEERLSSPHILHLTATPIPRTLALSLFGNFDVSVIEKPEQRITVATSVVPEQKRNDSYTWIANKVKEGGQVFWIFPLIEENEELNAFSIEVNFPKLEKRFKGLKLEKLHGKMRDKDKQDILNRFRDKKIDILISTTVIEVGIDIPNANLIVIEGAERFGLAQLHQLRGRVGRSNQESWCLLFPTNQDDNPALDRLNFFAKESNGIKIAEFDLQKRGPGEVYGFSQSGIPQMKVANFSDKKMLSETRNAAKELIARKA